MPHTRCDPVAGSDTGAWSPRRLRSTLLLPAAIALLLTAVPAVAGVTAAPAGADQISDLQAQAAQIAQTLVREQLQVGSFQQQYSVAAAQVAKDAAVVGQTQQQMNADQQRIDLDTGRVRTQALRDYMPDRSPRGSRSRSSPVAAAPTWPGASTSQSPRAT